MKGLSLSNVAKACNGTLYNYSEENDKEVSGVVIDSRKVKENFLFVAIKGERVDGHDFIEQVINANAAGVICEREQVNMTAPYILVKDSLQALKDMAEFYRKGLDIKVVGITGSVGKTSTKEFIATVLSEKYSVLKTEKNFNNEIGLPLTVLRIREEHEIAVLEVGISDFSEMHRLSKIARPDICVLTNIGQCHLENLKSREGVLEAKSEIFDFMKEDGFVCVNGDDDMLCGIKEVKGRKPYCFGMNESNRVYAKEIQNEGLFGSRARIYIDNQMLDVHIPLPGEHMIYNALAAALVGSLLELTKEEIKEGIRVVKPIDGRSHIMQLMKWVIIDDCYNANPVSMCSALDLLSTALTRKVAILGDMYELGEDRETLHEEVGTYAVTKGTHLIICIGELSKSMYKGACKAAEIQNIPQENIYYFPNKKEFIEKAFEILKRDDTILVKASRGMEFEEIVHILQKN